MAIKINGVTVIDDDRKGIFNKVSAGNYTTAEREALGSLSEGELVYDTTAKKLFIYDGTAWAGVGGGGGNGLVSSIPPFAAHAYTDTFLKSTDGKVQFSLDNSTYTTTLAVPRNTQYFVGWGTDIRHAANGSSYSASIGATFTQIGTSGTTTDIEYEISSIDKIPDLSVGFTSSSDVDTGAEFESDILNTFETINAPASIWVTSDASSYKLRIGVGTWFDPPGLIGTAFVVNRNEEIQVKHTTGSGSLTEYKTTVNVGYGTGAGEFVSVDFSTTTQQSGVNAPTLTTQTSIQPTYSTSAYSVVGDPGTHASSDWQIATDSGFSSIVVQSVNDTTNLTSWTPYVSVSAGTGQALGALSGATTYYFRCRHKSSNGTYSNYTTATITTDTLTTDFSTSSTTITRPGSNYTYTAFTVPAGIGRIRATLTGNNGGGTLVGTITVAPGEDLRIYNVEGAVGLFENLSVSGSSDRTKAFGVVGNRGGQSSGTNSDGNSNPAQYSGGQGGSSQADRGGFSGNSNHGTGGYGASDTAPGNGGANAGSDSIVRVPAAGSGFAGGIGGRRDPSGPAQCSGGNGGAGWYGGGGGGADDDNNHGGAGGGGSSKWQTPNSSSWRTLTNTTNTKGTSSNSTPQVVIEY
tara:strand:- start:58 stop:1956 length:1899 start_codon:yes stop_codon:yes gene_type:complete